MTDFPIFRPVAEHSLLVEFGDTITPQAHQSVLHLDQMLSKTPPKGFVESTPAYVNILVRFDPMVTDHAMLEPVLHQLINEPTSAQRQQSAHKVAVCYDPDLGPDLTEVAARTGLSQDAVINAHLSGDYSVFLYGFAPGYAYLGGLPAGLELPRKDAALRDIAAGSVIIAGAQCIVTTLTMPTGWWIIGRSNTQILREDHARPLLFDVGDRVKFHRVSRAEFEAAR